jgi:hypothetical protein
VGKDGAGAVGQTLCIWPLGVPPRSSTVADAWNTNNINIINHLLIAKPPLKPKKEKDCWADFGLAVYTVASCLQLLWYWILVEFNGLLSFELSCEHLMGLDILVEYPVPLGIGTPCAVEGVLGLYAD